MARPLSEATKQRLLRELCDSVNGVTAPYLVGMTAEQKSEFMALSVDEQKAYEKGFRHCEEQQKQRQRKRR